MNDYLIEMYKSILTGNNLLNVKSYNESLCVPKQIYTAWYCSTFSKDRL